MTSEDAASRAAVTWLVRVAAAHEIRGHVPVFSDPEATKLLRDVARLTADHRARRMASDVRRSAAGLADSLTGVYKKFKAAQASESEYEAAVEAACLEWGFEPRSVVLECLLKSPTQITDEGGPKEAALNGAGQAVKFQEGETAPVTGRTIRQRLRDDSPLDGDDGPRVAFASAPGKLDALMYLFRVFSVEPAEAIAAFERLGAQLSGRSPESLTRAEAHWLRCREERSSGNQVVIGE